MSFQIAIDPSRRAAARFIGLVRRGLQAAFVDNPECSRSNVAASIGVHRSVITRQLNGQADMSLGRVAEIAWALGLKPVILFESISPSDQTNRAPALAPAYSDNFVTMSSSGNDTVFVDIGRNSKPEQIYVEAV